MRTNHEHLVFAFAIHVACKQNTKHNYELKKYNTKYYNCSINNYLLVIIVN